MAEIVLTTENFEQEVLSSPLPVLVDFWATWCGPCRMVAPIVEQIAEEYEGKIKVGKVNVDEAPELADRFHVMNIPTLMVFRDGVPVQTAVGYHTREQLLALLR